MLFCRLLLTQGLLIFCKNYEAFWSFLMFLLMFCNLLLLMLWNYLKKCKWQWHWRRTSILTGILNLKIWIKLERAGVYSYMPRNKCQVECSQDTFLGNIDGLFLELKFKNSKLLSSGIYYPPPPPPSQNSQWFFNGLGKALD